MHMLLDCTIHMLLDSPMTDVVTADACHLVLRTFICKPKGQTVRHRPAQCNVEVHSLPSGRQLSLPAVLQSRAVTPQVMHNLHISFGPRSCFTTYVASQHVCTHRLLWHAMSFCFSKSQKAQDHQQLNRTFGVQVVMQAKRHHDQKAVRQCYNRLKEVQQQLAAQQVGAPNTRQLTA